jgi:hypothetical protein
MTPSQLIVKGWEDTHGDSVTLWADFIPDSAMNVFPIAAYIHAGFSDDDGPLSGSKLETERFEIIIQSLDRRQCRDLARRTKATFEALDHATLADSRAELAEFTVRRQDGASLYWETRVEVSLFLWDQSEV